MISFIIGVFIGGIMGVVTMSVLSVGGKNESHHNN